jgi:hypothetical protein
MRKNINIHNRPARSPSRKGVSSVRRIEVGARVRVKDVKEILIAGFIFHDDLGCVTSLLECALSIER